MLVRERERGELPSPNLSLSDRKVGQGLIVFGWPPVSREGGIFKLVCTNSDTSGDFRRVN